MLDPSSLSDRPRRLQTASRSTSAEPPTVTATKSASFSASATLHRPLQPRPFRVGRSGTPGWQIALGSSTCYRTLPSGSYTLPRQWSPAPPCPALPPLPPTPRWAASLRWPSSTSWSPWRPLRLNVRRPAGAGPGLCSGRLHRPDRRVPRLLARAGAGKANLQPRRPELRRCVGGGGSSGRDATFLFSNGVLVWGAGEPNNSGPIVRIPGKGRAHVGRPAGLTLLRVGRVRDGRIAALLSVGVRVWDVRPLGTAGPTASGTTTCSSVLRRSEAVCVCLGHRQWAQDHRVPHPRRLRAPRRAPGSQSTPPPRQYPLRALRRRRRRPQAAPLLRRRRSPG
jgi:hypothetical protein